MRYPEYENLSLPKAAIELIVVSCDHFSYDLSIARTDNQVDMRYLINMDYHADLPINSMGRRVRSRLYFTSESHLHSRKLPVYIIGSLLVSLPSQHGTQL